MDSPAFATGVTWIFPPPDPDPIETLVIYGSDAPMHGIPAEIAAWPTTICGIMILVFHV